MKKRTPVFSSGKKSGTDLSRQPGGIRTGALTHKSGVMNFQHEKDSYFGQQRHPYQDKGYGEMGDQLKEVFCLDNYI